MPHSDDYGFDDDDSAFIAAATQVEASQQNGFEDNPRPSKRQCVGSSPLQLDGHGSQELEWLQSNEKAHRFTKQHTLRTEGTSEQQENPDIEPNEDLEYYFPGELADPEGKENHDAKQSKYKIHVPKNGAQFEDQIFTQTQVDLDSSPSHFRGAVWKKPPAPPPPAPGFGQKQQAIGINGTICAVTNGNVNPQHFGQRQTNVNGFNRPPSGVARQNAHGSDRELAARLQAEANARNVHRLGHSSVYGPQAEMAEELADLPSDAFSSSPEKDALEITSYSTVSRTQPAGLRGPQKGLKQMTIFGQPATQTLSASQAANKKHAWPLKSKDEPPTHHKLNDKAMETWVYPTNLGTIRDYQYNIVNRSLFHNTLVALPTGLGKTFIAATVMLNYYRWTTEAQIVFMAPTKPLIAQQMEACYGIVGIPRHDTALMTGETTPAVRAEEWLEKRVFFMTPQTVVNDLKTGICDPKKIVLAVVDEAHKSTGSYAYTEFVKFMRRFNSSFRILALTATPGSKVEAVQDVIDNLSIARVELRTEQSLDIRQYTHEKHTETELFDYSDEQELIMELFSKALKPSLEKLCSQNAYWNRDPMQLTAYGLTLQRQKYTASEAGRRAAQPVKGMVNAIFTVLSSLAHGVSLLKFHGIGPFYSSVREFQKTVDSGKTKGKNAAQIAQSEDFTKMMGLMRGWTNNPDFIGHPKLQYLREVVLNHFLDTGEGMQGSNVPPSSTRVMVFASYRDSTEEICRVLKRNEPMIRPHVFVGQAASKDSEGMDQKRQNAVIQDFKSGKYNTLVATSIGEEGLDIGDVDLIVCYDASASPIRMLQRIGRTGRKRVGRVVLLLMRGKEENDYAKAQDNYAYIQKTIADANKYTYHDEQSPRILPKEVQPVVDKRQIDIPPENSQPIDLNERGKRAKGKAKAKRPPKKFHMPNGVRIGFVKASKMDSEDDSGSDRVAAPGGKTTGKAKAQLSTSKMQRKQIQDPDPAQLPFLEDVLLPPHQQQELERKYAHTADADADVLIRAPDPTRHPHSMRKLGTTKFINHGRVARAVASAMSKLRTIDDKAVARIKHLGQPNDILATLGDASVRLVKPETGQVEFDDDLPENPLLVNKSIEIPTKDSRPSTKTSRKLSSRDQNVGERRAPRTQKSRGRPRKAQPIRHIESFGSAAAEGDESSPEPTPAHLQIGTQGIDLGSRDTSGEDEDEELDSELDEFIVRSDQPIEMASSSQSLPNVSQPPRRENVRLATAKKAKLFSDDEDMEDDPGLAKTGVSSDSESDGVEDVGALSSVPVAAARKKRRVIDDSDDE